MSVVPAMPNNGLKSIRSFQPASNGATYTLIGFSDCDGKRYFTRNISRHGERTLQVVAEKLKVPCISLAHLNGQILPESQSLVLVSINSIWEICTFQNALDYVQKLSSFERKDLTAYPIRLLDKIEAEEVESKLIQQNFKNPLKEHLMVTSESKKEALLEG